MNDGPTEIAVLISSDDVRAVEFSLASGGRGPWHHHTHVVEHCYCLAGHLSVEIEGSPTVVLDAGQKCEIGAGVRHSVSNNSALTCRFLVVQGIGPYDFVEGESRSLHG